MRLLFLFALAGWLDTLLQRVIYDGTMNNGLSKSSFLPFHCFVIHACIYEKE